LTRNWASKIEISKIFRKFQFFWKFFGPDISVGGAITGTKIEIWYYNSQTSENHGPTMLVHDFHSFWN
jgi:hypothetical protein